MRKKLLIALGVLAVPIVAFLAYVAMQPSEYQVARTAMIEAPPARVFAHVNDFHLWDAWSPWAKLDPNAKSSFEGPDSGEGAKMSWDGNEKVGAGSMTIVKSEPNQTVDIDLEFIRPMADHADVRFTFQPVRERTEVTWTMSGKMNFVGKAMCLFMSMDKMIGGDFEKGLASLKQNVESQPEPELSPPPTEENPTEAPFDESATPSEES